MSIAKHAINHSDHFPIAVSEVTSDHDQNHDDENQTQHKCPECLIKKSFQSALQSDGSFYFDVLISLETYSFVKNDVVQNIISAHYQSHAPPAFLI